MRLGGAAACSVRLYWELEEPKGPQGRLVASAGAVLSDSKRSSPKRSSSVTPWKERAKLNAGAGAAFEPHGLTGWCAMGELARGDVGGGAGQRSACFAVSSSCGPRRVLELSLASRFPEPERRSRSFSFFKRPP